MANGINGILGGFESSRHVLEKRGFLNQYFVADSGNHCCF